MSDENNKDNKDNKNTVASVMKEILESCLRDQVFYQQFIMERGLSGEFTKFVEEKAAILKATSINIE